MHFVFQGIAVVSTVAVVISCPLFTWAQSAENARSDSYEIEWFGVSDTSREMSYCILTPYPQCERYVDISLSYGGGRVYGAAFQNRDENDSMQLYTDLTYQYRLLRSPSLQLGPSLGFEAELFQELWRSRTVASARGRLWVGPLVTFDFALGAVVSFNNRWGYRAVGGHSEIALTLHGQLGIYLQTQVLAGEQGVETRVTGGFRGSFMAWVCVVAGML